VTETTATEALSFHVLAEAAPGLLPRLLEPFARRDLIPDAVEATRRGALLEARIALAAVPAGMIHLLSGNLGQVIGVHSVRVAPLPAASILPWPEAAPADERRRAPRLSALP
jgi:asparagine N-glycosylation enzyme membrane subunit Stt3